MPRAEFIFHRLAAAEFRSARKWYSERSPDIAERFRNAVSLALDRASADPDALPILTGQFRYIRVSRYPYVLVLRRKTPDLIMIVAVSHTSRKPGYWRGRNL